MPGRTAFDLRDEPWIPVIDMDGIRTEVSLRSLLVQASRFRVLAGDLPTQDFALLRLVLAVIYCALNGPETQTDWHDLWSAPDLPADAVNAYLDRHDVASRLDLLHAETPFFQVADLRTAKDAVNWTLAKLIADVPNGSPYLTARTGAALNSVSYAEAARWLVHAQALDPSGIKSGAVGDERVKGGRGYPIGVAHAGNLGGIYAVGTNLRETLLLNLIPFEFLRLDPADRATWERDQQGPAEEDERSRGPRGVLSLYTWQSRRLRLFHDGDQVIGAMISNGDQLHPRNLHQLEPMTAWRRSENQEKLLKIGTVYLPRTHDHQRALWRGLGAILPPPGVVAADAKSLAPILSQWLARLGNAGLIDPAYRVSTCAVGVIYGSNQSVVDEIYADSLSMPLRAMDGDHPLRTAIVDCTADADAAVNALRSLARGVATAAGGDRGMQDGAAARAAEMAYADLDLRFRTMLMRIGANTSPTAIRIAWQRCVVAELRSHGERLIARAGPKAWIGRTVDGRHVSSSTADVRYRRALRTVLPLAMNEPNAPAPSPEPAPKKVLV